MKKRISIAFCILLCIPFVLGFSGSGSGTISDPYNISDCNLLDEMRLDLNADYQLTNSVDCSSFGNFIPIGNVSARFKGTFNGNNFVISNLSINSIDHVGFFGFTDNAKISNIGLTNINVLGKEGGYSTGGLIGYMNGGILSNSYVDNGYILGNWSNVGGLVGLFNDGIINNTYSKVNVFGQYNYVGGLIGWQTTGIVTNSYSTGNVTGSVYVGGLMGRQYSGVISNSFTTSIKITGSSSKGGLVGIKGGAIDNSYWLNTTTNPTNCYDNNNTGCTAKTDITWFKDENNEPLASWDFDNIWNIDSLVNDGFPFFDPSLMMLLDDSSGCIDGDTSISSICGDGVCSYAFEDCNSCSIDCGSCTPKLNVELTDYSLDGIADNTWDNGWWFKFDIDYDNADRIEPRWTDWKDGINIIPIEGNMRMEYHDEDGILKYYDVHNDYQEPASNYIDNIEDEDLTKPGIQATVTIRQKLPAYVIPGNYSSDYFWGLFII